MLPISDSIFPVFLSILYKQENPLDTFQFHQIINWLTDLNLVEDLSPRPCIAASDLAHLFYYIYVYDKSNRFFRNTN